MQIKQTLTTSLNDILNGIAQYCFHLSHVYQPQYPHPRASERKWMRTILCYVMCVWWKSLTLNIAQQSKVSPTATEAQLLATPTTIQTPYMVEENNVREKHHRPAHRGVRSAGAAAATNIHFSQPNNNNRQEKQAIYSGDCCRCRGVRGAAVWFLSAYKGSSSSNFCLDWSIIIRAISPHHTMAQQ